MTCRVILWVSSVICCLGIVAALCIVKYHALENWISKKIQLEVFQPQKPASKTSGDTRKPRNPSTISMITGGVSTTAAADAVVSTTRSIITISMTGTTTATAPTTTITTNTVTTTVTTTSINTVSINTSGGTTSINNVTATNVTNATTSTTRKGTIAVLVKTTSKSDMRELRSILLPSVVKHVHFSTPVTILYEGNERDLERMITDNFQTNGNLSYLLVNVTKFFLFTKEEFESKQNGGVTMGYRKMCEFWAVHVHFLPALASFHYLWRLDTDSELLADVTMNLYDVMRSRGALFGYGVEAVDAIRYCRGIQASSEYFFYHKNPQWAPRSYGARKFLRRFEGMSCPMMNTNFLLMDLDYFRGSAAYNAYVQYLKPNITRFRWGDHIVQTLFLRTQEPPDRLLCMKQWVAGYRHQGIPITCETRP
eukprot:gnl/MRDRNA2_/MRDRNA2_19310_c0_seq1.p1 gnl/MRDRNA2_/MRDRNA2_19310_c0~~gnl/MRDRNA2_/MRDRNA2_19310_c0_seq1.p1  ORF type:complete len:424 (+),score=41.30 gnl/MRDRNA2_/MRDRNA2_19310_c0_seq1:180-1451(+)